MMQRPYTAFWNYRECRRNPQEGFILREMPESSGSRCDYHRRNVYGGYFPHACPFVSHCIRYQADFGRRCESASQREPGSVLKDIISSGKFSVVELVKIFRQASQSDIVVNAHKINQGIPVSLDNKSMDFFFLKRYDANVIISVLITLIKKLPKFVDADL